MLDLSIAALVEEESRASHFAKCSGVENIDRKLSIKWMPL
jgi:hypothetical protein